MKDKIAKIWDERNSGDGEPYKKHVIDPLLLELLRPLKGKTVLDQGCGNGHFAKKLAQKNPSKIILLDLYEGNLEFARKNLSACDGEFEFKQCDLNSPLELKSEIIDCIVSSFVLSEIAELSLAVNETFRILKKDGSF